METWRIKRFWAKVNKNGPIHPVLKTRCWNWTGCLDKYGYGKFGDGKGHGSTKKAHRISWFLAHSVWPALHCLHKCDNPSCVRPSHLEDGSHAKNMADAVARGRISTANRALGENNGQHKLTEDEVRAIRERVASGEGYYTVAGEYNLNPKTVWGIVNRVYWAHV